MQAETITGAALAAILGFGNALLALYLNDSQLTYTAITEAAWVGMGLGAVLQFVKDYQALDTRRALHRMRRHHPITPDEAEKHD